MKLTVFSKAVIFAVVLGVGGFFINKGLDQVQDQAPQVPTQLDPLVQVPAQPVQPPVQEQVAPVRTAPVQTAQPAHVEPQIQPASEPSPVLKKPQTASDRGFDALLNHK